MTRSLAALLTLLVLHVSAFADARPLNVVFILTDNQGVWTLGCYGNPEIRTPHIDRLAEEGIRFTRAFASNAVCSPTRATFLTGLMPSQHGVHSFLDPKYMMGPEAYDTLREFPSLPKILSASGYTCGLVGKWHLGDNLRASHGFSYWFTKPDGSTREFYDVDLIDHGKVYREKRYTTEVFTEHAVKFIEQSSDKPFFLYLAYNGPYALGGLLKNRSRNRHADYYDTLEMTSFPRGPVHPRQYANIEYANTFTAARRVACEVSGVDDGVGEVMATLKRLGLDERTLVVYSTDQGWSGGHGGYYGMGDHTRPLTCTDMEIQIPLIFRHPRGIAGGVTSDVLTSNYDFVPTVLGYLGMAEKSPQASPGRDFSAVLRGGGAPANEREIYFEFEDTRMIRTETHKLIRRFPYGPDELYDLRADAEEKRDVHGDARLAAVQRDLSGRLEAFFSRYADPKWDLWRGGSSKAKLHSDGLRAMRRAGE